MLKQIRYFQSVVRHNSFTEAAAEHYISQSAISQQIKALEQELGLELLKRSRRSFTLTPAGEYFYRKSLVLIADFEAICRETAHIAGNSGEVLKIGVLRGYSGHEFQRAVAVFSAKFPDVSVEVSQGNHDELYDKLRHNDMDIAFNDQRRAFSDAYHNIILREQLYSIEISAKNPIAELESVAIEELKNIPCILIASKAQQETEMKFYHNDLGFSGDFLFSESVEDARMLLIQGKGFMPIEGSEQYVQLGAVTKRILLTRSGKPMVRKYCAFMKQNNPVRYTGEFLEILKHEFIKE